MATKTSDIYVANCSAYVQYGEDSSAFIRKGVTTVRAGHPLHTANPGMFSPFTVQYDVETAAVRPVKPTVKDTTETRGPGVDF